MREKALLRHFSCLIDIPLLISGGERQTGLETVSCAAVRSAAAARHRLRVDIEKRFTPK